MSERELFNQWFKKNFKDLYEAICCGDLVANNYKKAMYKAWQASANRKGYKLAPIEPNEEMIKAGKLAAVQPNYGITTVFNIYKAMIEAVGH